MVMNIMVMPMVAEHLPYHHQEMDRLLWTTLCRAWGKRCKNLDRIPMLVSRRHLLHTDKRLVLQQQAATAVKSHRVRAMLSTLSDSIPNCVVKSQQLN